MDDKFVLVFHSYSVSVVPLVFVIIWAVMVEIEMTPVKKPDYLMSQSPTPAGQDGQNLHISSTSFLLSCG